MKTLEQRREILKGFEKEVRAVKAKFKEEQRKGIYSWNTMRELAEVKNKVRGFGILHTIIKRRPDLNINRTTHISRELIVSLGIETKWRNQDKEYFYGVNFSKIFEDFIEG